MKKWDKWKKRILAFVVTGCMLLDSDMAVLAEETQKVVSNLYDEYVKAHGGKHAVEQSDTAFYRIHCIKRKLFVLLHIFIVCKRDSLHGCENRCQRSVNTACFSTDKLCDIRILLLRHDTAACAVCVIDLNEIGRAHV